MLAQFEYVTVKEKSLDSFNLLVPQY
jgi:hypothetical protein